MGVEEEKTKQNRREVEEDSTPLWIKIFGGSILSIAFLCVITLTSYIVNNINNIQSQLNSLHGDMITEKEYSDRQKLIWDSMKIDNDNISVLKERMNILESLLKDRQLWMEKHETKIAELCKIVELANKEIAAHKERANGAENQLMQLREEIRQFQKDIQSLRERVAAIEGKGNLVPEKKID